MSDYLDVKEVKITPVPRHSNATGYGGKVPTRYMLKLGSRWHRVYMMQYGNSGAPYVIVRGVDCMLDIETRHLLESL